MKVRGRSLGSQPVGSRKPRQVFKSFRCERSPGKLESMSLSYPLVQKLAGWCQPSNDRKWKKYRGSCLRDFALRMHVLCLWDASSWKKYGASSRMSTRSVSNQENVSGRFLLWCLRLRDDRCEEHLKKTLRHAASTPSSWLTIGLGPTYSYPRTKKTGGP